MKRINIATVFVSLLLISQIVMAQPKAVDLGLSVKWASCNVGATSPEEYGDYFAWGETSAKSDYSWSSHKYCMDNEGNHFSKYVPAHADAARYWGGNGAPDGKTVLEAGDDAARANWGGTWRMPTVLEWEELLTKCTWTWTTQGGKKGYKVTSKKNGNSIFLPAAGYLHGTNVIYPDYSGDYWSSSLNTDDPTCAWIMSSYIDVLGHETFRRSYDSRHRGRPVRPVSE